MKRKILMFVLSFVLIFPAILFAGCFGPKTTSYICALPENSYEGDLTAHIGQYTENWSVIHRNETIDETQYLVHYLYYNVTDEDDSERTYYYLGIWDENKEGNDKWVVYVLNDSNVWEKGTEGKDIDNHEIFGTDKYNFDYYGAEFNRHAVEARGFSFNRERNLVEENDEYIEYNLDGDIFKISNNIYHICLFRDWGTETPCSHEFSKFTFNVSDTPIPYISTLQLD